MYDEQLHNLYSSAGITQVIKSQRMKRARHIACMEKKKNAYTVLLGKPEGKAPFGRTWFG